jgi:hypothetical protein
MRKVKLERWYSPDCEAEYHYFLKEDNTSEAYVFAFNPKVIDREAAEKWLREQGFEIEQASKLQRMWRAAKCIWRA